MGAEKLYLSLILVAYRRYVVSYDISYSPNLDQINHMLNLKFMKIWDFIAVKDEFILRKI